MATIGQFAAILEADQRHEYRKQYPRTPDAVIDRACAVHVTRARRYTRVDVGDSGKYMVVNETGEIYGIKGYGVIHPGHQYGTLDTVGHFYWGGYLARPVDV
ncbi:MAG: hypothetical protein ACE5FA_04060 [Dehalococcoidia bacterium]